MFRKIRSLGAPERRPEMSAVLFLLQADALHMQIMQRTKDNAKVKFAPYPNGGNEINIMAFSTMAYSTSGKLTLN